MRLGLTSFFTNSPPDFTERFPDGYSSTPYFALIDRQNAIGWDHFIRGKLSTEWELSQYFYAKKYGLQKASEGWLITLIRLLATSSYQLWEIRNDCRHGKDAATQRQALQEQTQRELRCLYQLRPLVLAQDRTLFRNTVELHLSETVPQQRSWLLHHKKLIVHSVKVAAAQAKLQTHHIQRFFTRHKILQSKTARSINPPVTSRRQVPSRISNHFHPRNISVSTHRTPVSTIPPKLRNSDMSAYFQVLGTNRSILPIINEDTTLTTTSIQRRQLRRRLLNTPGLYPDHPG